MINKLRQRLATFAVIAVATTLCFCSVAPTESMLQQREQGNGSNGGNGGDMLALAFANVAWKVYRELESGFANQQSPYQKTLAPMRAKMERFFAELSDRAIYTVEDLRDEKGRPVAEKWGFQRAQYYPKDTARAARLPSSAIALSSWQDTERSGTALLAYDSSRAAGIAQIQIDLSSGEATVLIDRDLNDAIRAGSLFRAVCVRARRQPAGEVLQCRPGEGLGLAAEFTVVPDGGGKPTVDALRLFRQEAYLFISGATWRPRLMGTSQFTSQTKRDVFRVYQTLLGVPGDDLPFHYQSFPRVGAAVRILGETRFLWQREEDPSVFTQWEWTDDRPRHTAPGNPLVGTIQAILPSDVGTVVRVLPNAAVIQQGLWAIRRHNPVVGIHPITGKPARQRKDDWLWIHWSSQAFALPRFKTLRNQANQMIPALEMPANGGLLFFLENVEPVETAP